MLELIKTIFSKLLPVFITSWLKKKFVRDDIQGYKLTRRKRKDKRLDKLEKQIEGLANEINKTTETMLESWSLGCYYKHYNERYELLKERKELYQRWQRISKGKTYPQR